MNVKLNLERKICLRILLCAGILYAGTTTHTAKAQTYDPYAVQVINNLIANNGLQATLDAPETWVFATWNDETPKQIIELILCYKNLTGIASFEGLTTLQTLICHGNNLTKLYATNCKTLQALTCQWNSIDKLEVANCFNLQILRCYDNKLIELDLTNCQQLEEINIGVNELTTFDVTNQKQLKYISCSRNKLNKINVAGLILHNLWCDENRLTEIDLTGVKLEDFEAFNQKVPLTLYENKEGEYTTPILLNKPSFGNSKVSYSDGILKSTDNSVDKTNFIVRTIGNNNYEISGVMHFTYTITDIKSPENINLKIYPNPTTGELIIENGELRIKSIEIFDINGRKQKAEGRKQKAGEMVIDMFHLPTGIYLLHIDTDKGEIIKKIVKQ